MIQQDHADAPVQELFGFERVGALPNGTTTTVTLTVPPQVLSVVDVNGVESLRAGVYNISVGGAPDGFAVAQLSVSGPTHEVFRLPSDLKPVR